MERHRLAAACIALVAVTAGCSGVFSGESVTPTATPGDAGPEIAPGVPAVEQNGTEVGVDTDRLRSANARFRTNTSYTVQRTVTVTDSDGNGTLVFDRARLATPDVTLEYLDIDQSGQFSAVLSGGTRWTDDTGTWTRSNLSNGRTSVTERLDGNLDPYGYGTDLVNRSLSADTYQVRTDGDDAVLLTRALDLDGESLIPISTGAPVDERVRLVVDDSGFVRSLAVRYNTIYGTESVSVTIRHDLRNVGETAVQRPAWVPNDG
jgi:hypothetical protein